MGREQYTEPVARVITVTDNTGDHKVAELLDDIQITVWKLNPDGSREATPANLFADRSSATPFAGGNPFVTVNGGKTNFWADAGEYELDFHDIDGVRIGDQTLGWQAHGGNVAGIPVTQLPEQGRGLAPPGSIFATAAVNLPAGYLWCDGSKQDRNTYAALFTAISTAYNTTGEAASEFRLPDLRGRSPIGADDFGTGAGGRLPSLGAANRVRGKSGGEDATTLAIAHMPSHTHGITDPTHDHGSRSVAFYLYDGGAGGINATGAGGFSGTSAGTTAGSGAGISINPNGSGQAHNNLPPYQLCHFIIKT